MEDLRRVFFHELGHFIAHEINQKYYGGLGVKAFFIHPHRLEDELFEGRVVINSSGDEEYIPTREELPTYLASSSYGCMFQAYYKNESLKNCFGINGGEDSKNWNGILWKYQLGDCCAEFSLIEEEYFKLLKQNAELDSLMTLDPQAYLNGDKFHNYSADLNRLKADTSNFVENHQKVYDSLIEKYKEEINRCDLEYNAK